MSEGSSTGPNVIDRREPSAQHPVLIHFVEGIEIQEFAEGHAPSNFDLGYDLFHIPMEARVPYNPVAITNEDVKEAIRNHPIMHMECDLCHMFMRSKKAGTYQLCASCEESESYRTGSRYLKNLPNRGQKRPQPATSSQPPRKAVMMAKRPRLEENHLSSDSDSDDSDSDSDDSDSDSASNDLPSDVSDDNRDSDDQSNNDGDDDDDDEDDDDDDDSDDYAPEDDDEEEEEERPQLRQIKEEIMDEEEEVAEPPPPVLRPIKQEIVEEDNTVKEVRNGQREVIYLKYVTKEEATIIAQKYIERNRARADGMPTLERQVGYGSNSGPSSSNIVTDEASNDAEFLEKNLPLRTWSVSTAARWVAVVTNSMVAAEAFEREEIDGVVLAEATIEELKPLMDIKFGPMAKFENAFRRLKKSHVTTI